MTSNEPSPIATVSQPNAAALLLHPLRQRILHEACSPSSAAEIARRLELAPQKVNYHVRALVEGGLLVRAGERLKRNLVEKRYRASARAYVLLPAVLGEIGPERLSLPEEASAAHLLQLASRVQSELSETLRESRSQGGEAPTVSLDVELRLSSPGQRAAFAAALRDAVIELVGRFCDPAVTRDGAPATGRPYRMVVACYPLAGSDEPGRSRPSALGGAEEDCQ